VRGASVLTTAVVWFGLPSLRPREVQVAATARIAAHPSTIGFHDPDSYFMTDANVNQTFARCWTQESRTSG
jgi:hypothetical protein